MHRRVLPARYAACAVLAGFVACFVGAVWAGAVSLVGQLDPNDQQDVFLYQFTLSAPGSVAIQTWGYGGTLSAPGDVNAQGNPIAPGGFDPYVTVFSGNGPAAALLASNDDGSCPPGTISAGFCRDSTLALPALPAGTYTMALSSFENMSLAENYGGGTLADGFVGLGSFGGRTNSYAVDISGATVVAPLLALAYVPNALTFGPQTLNVASGPLTITVTNTGAAPVALGGLVLGGANAAEFATGGDCTGSIGVGAICVINVTFRPTATGLRVATLSIISSASGSPALINVSGSGTASAVASAALTTTDLDFGSLPAGRPSLPLTLVVTSVGGAPLVIGVNSEGGTNPGDFGITDNCAGQTLGAGATCAFSVVFTPLASGPRSATLTINTNASNNPLTVTLRGAGFVAPIPTPALDGWGLVALSLLLALGAILARRRDAQR